MSATKALCRSCQSATSIDQTCLYCSTVLCPSCQPICTECKRELYQTYGGDSGYEWRVNWSETHNWFEAQKKRTRRVVTLSFALMVLGAFLIIFGYTSPAPHSPFILYGLGVLLSALPLHFVANSFLTRESQ